MAFLKTKVAKGRKYYALAESYRDDQGKPRQKIIANLGAAQKAIAYFNCSDNDFSSNNYLQFVNRIALDAVKRCKQCGSEDIYWSPNPPHWHRYGCNSCHNMDWYDNKIIFESMNLGLYEKCRMNQNHDPVAYKIVKFLLSQSEDFKVLKYIKYKTYENLIDYYYVLTKDHIVYDLSVGAANEIFAKYVNLSDQLIKRKFKL